MTVRTYYGNERVTVEGRNGTRLPGTVSGVAGGRIVVALDEASDVYPLLGPEGAAVAGHIAQVLERDLEFYVTGSESSAPSFTPEQLSYLKRTYGDTVEAVEAEERIAISASAVENEGTEDEEAAAAAAAAKAQGTGLSQAQVANAKLPDGA